MSLDKIIQSIPLDKKDHVLLGIAVGYPLIAFGYLIDLFFQSNYMLIVGGVAGIVLVAAKEIIYDRIMKRGNPELNDFLASAIPIVFPLLCYLTGL